MDLGDRMKAYEETFRHVLPVRMPAIIRLDGKVFHSLTRKCERPFDTKLRDTIVYAAAAIMEEIPARMAYHQSDEVSLLLVDYNRFDSEQWFKGSVQKMVSVAASMMGVEFSSRWGRAGYFDARVFVVPERDIENYFIWRQRDAMRNAVSMAAQSVFSPKQLHGKHTNDMIGMLEDNGILFDSYPGWFRFGSVVTKKSCEAAPIFSGNREYLQQYLTVEES